MEVRQFGVTMALCGALLLSSFSLSMATVPKSAAEAIEKGKALEKSFDFSSAIDAFTEAIRLDPKSGEAYRERGAAYNANEEYDLAIADFTEAIRLSPSDGEAYVGRGVSHGSKSETGKAKADYMRAIAACDETIRRDPSNAEAHITRGFGYFYSEEHDKAIADFTEAIQIAPANATAYHSRGCVYDLKSTLCRLQGDSDKAAKAGADAVKDWTEAVRLDPKHIDSYMALGMTFAAIGDHEKAITKFTQAIDLAPRCDSAYCLRGSNFRDKGDVEKGIVDLTEAIRLRPKSAVAYWERGLAYKKKGENTKADSDFVLAKNLGYQDTPINGEPNPDSQESLLDRDADLRELQTFMQSGPNDVRDILVMEDGFLVATGAAIIRYRYSGETPMAAAVYTSHDGLPSGNCYLLKRDADGGVWAYCQGGVGYLPAKAVQWKAFSTESGLAPGNATDIALSADGKRVWVASTGGLSTALVKDCRWQVFSAKNLTDMFVHPTKDVVWCRKLMQSGCMCGRHVSWLQFDLQGGTWREVPDSGDCEHVAPTPSCFDVNHGALWMLRGVEPPKVYDLKKNMTRTWPKEPRWERRKDGNTVEYWDWFGEMSSLAKDSGGVWFATNAGLWSYDPVKDHWEGHLRNSDPGCGQPLLVKSIDGKTFYWSCDGNVAAYDVPADKWTDLWDVEHNSLREGRHSLTLSPDGKFLWLLGLKGVVVGPISNKTGVVLDDKDQPGLSDAQFVRFDFCKRLALIGTPQCVVCTDYSGAVKFMLSRPAPPIHHKVTRFAFVPDGNEVWCLMRDERGFDMPAAVLYPRKNRWELVPDAKISGRLLEVVSSDGKTVWMSQADRRQRLIAGATRGPLREKIPVELNNVKQLWLTPKGDELWTATSSDGLFRVRLASDDVTQYAERDSGHSSYITENHTLIGDFIDDMVFTAHGKLAVCSAGGGGMHGLALIDLASGKATNYPKEHFGDTKLLASPDNRTVWCDVNRRSLLAFDTQTGTWTHEWMAGKGMPLSCFRAFQCSLDGKFLWLCGWEGAAVYCVAEKSWKTFLGEQWRAIPDVPPPLCIASDGRHILCSHREGLALIKIDGSSHELLTLATGEKNCEVTHLIVLPGTNDYVCSISHPRVGGIYYVDTKHRRLRMVKELKESVVSALTIGADGFLWGAIPGSVFCVNPSTGEARADLEALRFGEPSTKTLTRRAASSESRFTPSPRNLPNEGETHATKE